MIPGLPRRTARHRISLPPILTGAWRTLSIQRPRLVDPLLFRGEAIAMPGL